MKVIRGNLLKKTTRKITTQEGGFLHLLKTLMIMYLPLMENVFTPLAGSILSLLGVTAKVWAIDAAI